MCVLIQVPFLSYFKVVPLPVIYGLFFYMGYSALVANDLIERVGLFFTEASLFPPNHVFRKATQRILSPFLCAFFFSS